MAGMDFFERQWTSYRAIVEHDLMEHQAVARATAAGIDSWLAARPAGAPAPHLVDLGCGDLALLAPLLQRLPLASYTGLDLTAAVLPLAKQALGAVPYPSHWLEADLLAWAQADPANASGARPVDILHSAFAIHHLTDPDKATFLQAARQRIAPGGVFLWVDVFRQPGESREEYVARYKRRIAAQWPQLTAEQQQHVTSHLSTYDIPADRQAIEAAATVAGWRWSWGWHGAHQAEAMAVLTPAP
jgi:cyclopropane fatty-acyl-phospholipid synthase-like methyltransferase